MLTIDQFFTAPGLSTGLLPASPADASSLRYRWPGSVIVREVRGPVMPTVAGVFNEFAAAFQFPYYFGHNKDAFDECMRDLDEFVGPAGRYLVVVREAPGLLAGAPVERDWFFGAMDFYATEWIRRGVAFRVVLQAPPASSSATQPIAGPDWPVRLGLPLLSLS
jgi:hypothetical protein